MKFQMTKTKIFWLLFTINLFNYIDRQILYSVFPLLKDDLALSDTQLGSLASAFMIVYMLYAPISGYFADRGKRTGWMGWNIIVWSFATIGSAFATGYKSLLGARSLIGVGEAGFTSIAQGYLAELYPKENRARILAAFGLAIPMGSALGYLLGGFMGNHFGWRAAFIIVAVPGIFLGLCVLFLKDKKRENMTPEQKPTLKGYLDLLLNKKYIFISLSQAMTTFVVGGLAAWMPSYYNRFFGLDTAQSGLIFGISVIIAGAAGTFAGGQISERVFRANKNAYFITSFIGLACTIPFAVMGVISKNMWLASVMFSIAMTFAFIPTGPLNAAIVNITSSTIRSMAFALNIFIIHALGDAISPVIIGRLSDMWGLKIAVLLCFVTILPACIFVVAAAKAKMDTQTENN
ncbi:putative arabinose efflux permease [Parelusimicrobium proximum]|uniref:spinster family MFS transporter n=1 Tax=Parelusimicrobium proximum TaxID=3228953 RepID=UPI003D178410